MRIENLLVVVPADSDAVPSSAQSLSSFSSSAAAAASAAPPVNLAAARASGGGKCYLKFERLTHIPIQKALLDMDLLTPCEVAWLDAYHAEVCARVGPLLASKPEALAWLEDATSPLSFTK